MAKPIGAKVKNDLPADVATTDKLSLPALQMIWNTIGPQSRLAIFAPVDDPVRHEIVQWLQRQAQAQQPPQTTEAK